MGTSVVTIVILCSTALSAPVSVSISSTDMPKSITPMFFGVSAEYFRPGLALGTLPKDDARSLCREFASALKDSGIRLLRFPGGMYTYDYLPESEDGSLALRESFTPYSAKDTFDFGHFVSVNQLMDFCREAGIQVMYSVNMCFYWDGTQPRAIVQGDFTTEAPEYYDHDRLEEAAGRLRTLVRHCVEQDYPVAAWELGNEDFAWGQAEGYARVAAGYIQAIRAEDPETPIIMVGQGGDWQQEVLDRLHEAGVAGELWAISTHYPFGNWYLPGEGRDGNAPADYVLADMMMWKWLGSGPAGAHEAGYADIKWATTETMMFRHQEWNSGRMSPSFAYGLAVAYNWMCLLRHPQNVAAVFHDLETTYFGILKFNVQYTPFRGQAEGGYDELESLSVERPDDCPPRWWFAKQYVRTPAALAYRLLSTLSGTKLLATEIERGEMQPAAFDCLAGRNGEGNIQVVAVNRGAHTVQAKISGLGELAFSGHKECLQAVSLESCTPDEYGIYSRLEEPQRGEQIEVTIPAWSVTSLVLAPGE